MAEFRMEAHACRIYGVIKAEESNVTLTELSRRLGIARATVRHIVRRRGWKVRNGSGDVLERFNAGRTEPQELNFE